MPGMPIALVDASREAETEGVGEFQDLVYAHQKMVFGIAYHCLRDAALAEDVAQEVFLRLSQSLPKLRSPDHVVFWLRQVTSRLCIDEMRRHRPAANLEDVGEPAVCQDPGDLLLSERLRELVGQLPSAARLAVVMRYQEDMEPMEIAKLLREPVATVKSRLQRALTTLRKGLEPFGGGVG